MGRSWVCMMCESFIEYWNFVFCYRAQSHIDLLYIIYLIKLFQLKECYCYCCSCLTNFFIHLWLFINVNQSNVAHSVTNKFETIKLLWKFHFTVWVWLSFCVIFLMNSTFPKMYQCILSYLSILVLFLGFKAIHDRNLCSRTDQRKK